MSRVSVVIATLGGSSLASTVEKLNAGSLVPSEILICIPFSEHNNVNFSFAENVSVIPTSIRGQVAQRALGFGRARHEYVLQLDDDMSVDRYCLQRLVEALEILGSRASVSPALTDSRTGLSVYRKPEGPRCLVLMFFWLTNGAKGYQPGTIDLAGSAIGVDPASSAVRFVEVEWLAGGCVLHRRGNLILEDFWKRPGKAYCEDILHSHLLHRRKIRLFVDTSARCDLEVVRQNEMSFGSFLIDLSRDFSARKYCMKRVSDVSLNMYLYYLIRFASYVLSILRLRR